MRITRKELGPVRDALDILALALANKRHVWTSEERRAYEAAARVLAT